MNINIRATQIGTRFIMEESHQLAEKFTTEPYH